MDVLEIPFDTNIPHYTQQTELDGKTYTLEFEYIERENFWMLHISDQDGNPLVWGIKLITEWPLLKREVDVLNGKLLLLAINQLVYLSCLATT